MPAPPGQGMGQPDARPASRSSRCRGSWPPPPTARASCAGRDPHTEPGIRLMAKGWLKLLVGCAEDRPWRTSVRSRSFPRRRRWRPPTARPGRGRLRRALHARGRRTSSPPPAPPVRVPRPLVRRPESTVADVFFHLDEYVGVPATHPASFPALSAGADRESGRPRARFHFIGRRPRPIRRRRPRGWGR